MTGILLINLGTPDSPETGDVRKYLREFLSDGRVIDIPWIRRKMLVNCIIAPFRAPESARQYKMVWTPEGSPLLAAGIRLKDKLQQKLGAEFIVELAMRYRQPAVGDMLERMSGKVSRIIVVPLYPQFASSTTGSTFDKVMAELGKKEVVPDVKFTGPFFNHPEFIKAFAAIAQRKNRLQDYDHYLFSYHGLPERHILKASDERGMNCTPAANSGKDCCSVLNEKNFFCYRASCYHTTRLIAGALNLSEGSYSVSFQSRLGRTPWIKPYTDEVIAEKAKAGVKKMLCFSPAFVADCLETLYEIKVLYNDLFREHGGEELHLAPSLNDEDEWVEALTKIVVPT